MFFYNIILFNDVFLTKMIDVRSVVCRKKPLCTGGGRPDMVKSIDEFPKNASKEDSEALGIILARYLAMPVTKLLNCLQLFGVYCF